MPRCERCYDDASRRVEYASVRADAESVALRHGDTLRELTTFFEAASDATADACRFL